MVKIRENVFFPHLSELNGEKMVGKWTDKWLVNGWKMAP